MIQYKYAIVNWILTENSFFCGYYGKQNFMEFFFFFTVLWKFCYVILAEKIILEKTLISDFGEKLSLMTDKKI